jgi:fatty acid desaturase
MPDNSLPRSVSVSLIVAQTIEARAWDWPTIGIALFLYGSFAVVTWHWHELPIWLAVALGTILLAWHGSLQHETIHGHPTPFRPLNALLGAAPLALWLPYSLYREAHLGHHANGGRDLTDPDADPESHYRRPGTLAAIGRLERLALRWHATLSGRMVIGPALLIQRCWRSEARRFARDPHCRRMWLRHGLAIVPILVWIIGVCDIPLVIYLGLVVYLSISITLLRSFAEHRAAPDPQHRTVVVEAGPFWRLLFLNNNLHIAHHRHPDLPWYRLPAAWRALRAELDLPPAMLFRGGYTEIAALHLLAPAAPIEHPGFGSSA